MIPLDTPMSNVSSLYSNRKLKAIIHGNRLIVFAATIVCLIALIFTEMAAVKKESAAQSIIAAGREQALSERVLSRMQTISAFQTRSVAVDTDIEELEQSFAEWRADHELILNKAKKADAHEVQEAIAQTTPWRKILFAQGRAITNSRGRAPISLQSASFAQKKFSIEQDRVLKALENYNANQIQAAHKAHWLSFALVLTILLIQTTGVVRPLLVRQQQTVRSLQDNQLQLEETRRELQIQNRSLQASRDAILATTVRFEDMAKLSRFSAARFEELFASIPIAACTFDSEGTVFEWNREAQMLFGIAGCNAVGKSLTTLMALPENVEEYKAMVSGVFSRNHLYNIERRIRRPNGEIRKVIFNTFPLIDPEGHVNGGVCSMIDVTEQRLAEERLKKSESRFREMVDDLPTGAVLIEGDSIHVNRYVELITGIGREEFTTLDKWFSLVYRENAPTARDVYNKAKAANFPCHRVQPIISRGGETKHIEFSAYQSEHSEVWILKDVSERLASQERFKILFEYSTDAHLLYDQSGIIDCNEATVKMLGARSRQEVFTHHPAIFSPEFQPDGKLSSEKSIEMEQIALTTGYHQFEWIHRKADGSLFPVEVTITPVVISGNTTLLVVWHDLTEQKEAQAALESAIKDLNEAQSLAHVGSWQCDRALTSVWFSPETHSILGLAEHELPNLTMLSKFIHSDDLQSFRSHFLSAVRRWKGAEIEIRVIRPTGEERIIVCTGRPQRDGARYVGTIRDVTLERIAARQISESESLFRASLDAMHSGVVYMDSSEVITRTNPKGAEILGLNSQQVVGSSPCDARWGNIREDWSDLSPDETPLIQAFRQGVPVADFVHGVRRPDGALVWISVNAAPVFLPGQQKPIGAVSSFTDITETRKYQELLLTEMVKTNELAVDLELQKAALVEANERLNALATTDGLTGLNNHRRFQEYLEQAFAIATRNQSPLSLILLDVDFFKRFNDEFGHQAGDKVLKGVASVLQSTARISDFVARYGGEEFVIVLSGIDSENAIATAERFRKTIQENDWPYTGVTSSFGVATLTQTMSTREQLIAEADKALYQAKREGRNRVCHAQDYIDKAA